MQRPATRWVTEDGFSYFRLEAASVMTEESWLGAAEAVPPAPSAQAGEASPPTLYAIVVKTGVEDVSTFRRVEAMLRLVAARGYARAFVANISDNSFEQLNINLAAALGAGAGVVYEGLLAASEEAAVDWLRAQADAGRSDTPAARSA